MSGSGGAGPRVVLACDFMLRYTAMLAGALGRAGAQMMLLTRDHDLEFGGRPGAAAEFIADAVGDNVVHRVLEGRLRSPRGWTQALRLRRGELRAFSPDVVHVSEAVINDPRLLLAARARPRRFALTCHDPTLHPGDSVSPWDRLSNPTIVRAAGLIFVHGESLREELLDRFSPSGPVVVVPHGIDPGTPAPPPARPAILFFGRISHYKGLDILLDAMADVWRELPEATLTIAGVGEIGDHPAFRDQRVSVRSGHVPDSEVPSLIAAASCVALPYRQASQSGVGSLVKPHGRPLVATAVGGLPDLLADGSGLLVPPEDPPKLAQALVEVLSDRELASRLAEAGSRTATREGSWDAVAARTLAAYEEHLLRETR